MSAVNIFLQADRAVLCTDTKVTTAAGEQYNAVKFAVLPWLRIAIAVRGNVGALRVFERAISCNAATYEGAVQLLVERFADILAEKYVDASEAFAMTQDLDVYLVGLGINGPAAHWISNYRTGGRVRRIDGVHVSPMVDLEAQRRYADDPKGGLPSLMADQTKQNPAVGGWLMVTEISDMGILSYPLGGLDALSSVGSRMQPREEVEALAAIEAANAERTALSKAAEGTRTKLAM